MLELHPLCTLFPAIDEEAMCALREDIRANGQQNPIVLLDGKILDGRNRYYACLDIDVEPIAVPFTGGDPLAFVLSVNLHRRHLTGAQRAAVAAKLANMSLGDNKGAHRPPEGSANLPTLTSQVSQADAAKMLNVSTRSVTEAKRIQQTDPELANAIESGDVSLHAASKVANLPAEQRKEIVAAGTEAINEAARTAAQPKQRSGAKDNPPPAESILVAELRDAIERLEEANLALTELNKDLEEQNAALAQAVDPEVLTLIQQARAYAAQLEQRRDGLMASEAKLMSELKKAERKIDRLHKEIDTLKSGGANA